MCGLSQAERDARVRVAGCISRPKSQFNSKHSKREQHFYPLSRFQPRRFVAVGKQAPFNGTLFWSTTIVYSVHLHLSIHWTRRLRSHPTSCLHALTASTTAASSAGFRQISQHSAGTYASKELRKGRSRLDSSAASSQERSHRTTRGQKQLPTITKAFVCSKR